MKSKTFFNMVILTGLLYILLCNCKKEAIKVIPTVTLATVTNITSNSATSGGEVTSDGGATVTVKGVCWSTNQNPTISDNKTSNGTGSGSFTSSISGLTPGGTFYIRAYAINAVGTAYSSQAIFSAIAIAPVITTTDLTAITTSTATSGGNITTDGGSSVTVRGVCWSITQNPTTTNSKTTDGAGTGTFTSNITGLLPGTIYYVKAYATNSVGTTYGNQLTLTTTAVAPSLTTVTASAVGSTTATSGGNITSDGGSAITVRGVCWATTQNPTTANPKTTNGTGVGSFSSSITGLTRTTTYYIRAYATNSIGTSYGNQETFNTLADVPTLTTTAVSAITYTTAISGGIITSDGGSAIIAKGVCWATTTNPTISNNKTVEGTGTGTFASNISGLTAWVTYYLRAYATNGMGTSYGPEISFISGTVPDNDGNVYRYITIGTQVWMVDNLKTTKYRNGDPITNVTGSTWSGQVTGAYCWYNNDEANKPAYGALYNWYAVADSRKIAPSGWHVATDPEWTTLAAYLGGGSVAVGKLKETGFAHWYSPNTGATNSSGFTALPGGCHNVSAFFNMWGGGYWWTSTQSSSSIAFFEYISYDSIGTLKESGEKFNGMSVRCVKD